MPKHFSTWEQICRAPTYLKAATIGVPAPGGRAGISDVREAYAKTDASFDQKFNKRASSYEGFCKQWNALNGDALIDSASIAHIVMGYFNHNPNGEVCIINSKRGNTPTSVEIRAPRGAWVEIWSA